MFISTAYQFLDYLKTVKNASVHTIRNYAIDLNSLRLFLEIHWEKEKKLKLSIPKINPCIPFEENPSHKMLPLCSLDRKTLRYYFSWVHQEGANKKSLARKISSLRSFFKYALLQKIIQENPMEGIENPKIDKKIPYILTYEQIEHLFSQPKLDSYLGVRDRAIMELFYSSGLRVSELVSLDRLDFDPENFLLKIKGKGKKQRVVPITKNAAYWVNQVLGHPERFVDIDGHLGEQDEKAIFLNKWGTRLTTRSVDRKFDEYICASGLAGKATPHTIRHTIATHWLENGMDLKTIREILGHSSLITTTIYTQVSTKLKKKAYDSAHPRA